MSFKQFSCSIKCKECSFSPDKINDFSRNKNMFCLHYDIMKVKCGMFLNVIYYTAKGTGSRFLHN